MNPILVANYALCKKYPDTYLSTPLLQHENYEEGSVQLPIRELGSIQKKWFIALKLWNGNFFFAANWISSSLDSFRWMRFSFIIMKRTFIKCIYCIIFRFILYLKNKRFYIGFSRISTNWCWEMNTVCLYL